MAVAWKTRVWQKSTSSPLGTWLRLARTSRLIERELSRRLRLKHGHSHGMSRFDVLSQLSRIDKDWVAVGKLSKMLLAEHAGITRLIDRMIADGLVKRRSNPLDRRSFQIAITKFGRKHFEAIAADHAAWTEEIFESIGTDGREKLIELLAELTEGTLKRD